MFASQSSANESKSRFQVLSITCPNTFCGRQKYNKEVNSVSVCSTIGRSKNDKQQIYSHIDRLTENYLFNNEIQTQCLLLENRECRS